VRHRLGFYGAYGVICLLLQVAQLAKVTPVSAGDIDPSLARLVHAAGNGPCPDSGAASVCPDDESFEHLAAEFAGAVAPVVGRGAATDGARGFYLGLNSTLTTIRSDSRYWARGTRGSDPNASHNANVDAALSWNRLELRKGLPFGFEIGSSLGFGLHTSLWSFAVELKLALFEGFRTGLGALPDVAVRAVTQQLLGSSEFSLRTQVVDITLSKPFVVLREHTLTPLLALQLLFVNAKSGVVDLTPANQAFRACSPAAGEPATCTQAGGASELASNVTFKSVSQTRVRMFLGAEERFRLLSIALTVGFDLTTPRLQSETPGDTLPRDLLRQFSLHLACGMRY
jgi:hypothetical protein